MEKFEHAICPDQFTIESRLIDLPDCLWRQIPFYYSQCFEVANVDCSWLNDEIKAFEYRVVPV